VTTDADRIDATYARYCLGEALFRITEIADARGTPMDELLVQIPPMPDGLEANWDVPTWARLRIVETGRGDLPPKGDDA
jgi:hypothetical protein